MFTLTLVTPEKKLLEQAEIAEVFVPADRGELNILPGHAPLITTLNAGVLKYRLASDPTLRHVALSWGYCQAGPDGVVVLADTAERPDELDREKLSSAIRSVESRLSSHDLDSVELVQVQRELEVEKARQEVSELSH